MNFNEFVITRVQKISAKTWQLSKAENNESSNPTKMSPLFVIVAENRVLKLKIL